METALRANNGKLPWSLMDFEAMRHLAPHYAGGWHGANWNVLEETLRVLMFGAQKYAPNNWKKGLKFSLTADCAIRHTLKALKGEVADSESNLNHYAHTLCNLMFLSYYADYCPSFDDRVETSIVREYYVPSEDPADEAEAVEALLAVLGAYMNGVDTDPLTELPLLGYAMFYTCQAYAFQQTVTVFKGASVGRSELTLTNEVRKEALGFTIEPINNGSDFNVVREQCVDVGDRPGCTFPHCNCGSPAGQDHGVII